MPLRVACTAGHLMMVPDHRAGTVLRCSKCGIEVHVPAAAGKSSLPAHPKPQVALAMQQSPQVAGHSTMAQLAAPIAPAPIKPPPKSRAKPQPAAEEKVARPAAVPVEVVTSHPTEPKPAPAIVAAAVTPPTVDPALIETVELPPQPVTKNAEVRKPPATELPRPKPEISNRPRATMTGTVLAPPPEPEQTKPEPLYIGDEPAPPAFVQPARFTTEPSLAHEPPPVAPPIALLLGVQATPAQRLTAWQLGAVLLAAAFFSIGPAIWEISDYLRSDGEQPVARWAFLLLMLGVVQIGCSLLLLQVPDWSSVWIVTVQSLALAAIYAAVLGLTIITSGDSPLISALDLHFQYSSGKAPPWCICMAAIYASLAFFAGRTSARWHKVLRQVQAAEQSAAMY